MSTRKLQQEFDKTNKKIAEGLSVFDDIYEKLTTSELNSLKEKLENDLKKEIKKLQRSRDQLKQWLGDSSIKLDKNLLQENRTKIEHAMDQFKDLEKFSKIKQFSNEGLELQNKKSRFSKFNDPADAKKKEACDYISDVIDQINQQNEGLELEIHQYTVQLKKSKSSALNSIQAAIDDLRYKIDRNNGHLTQLEKILRSIENEKLDPEKVDDIKDDLDYYVETNQEDDYVEYDDFYDQLELDDEGFDIHIVPGEVDHEGAPIAGGAGPVASAAGAVAGAVGAGAGVISGAVTGAAGAVANAISGSTSTPAAAAAAASPVATNGGSATAKKIVPAANPPPPPLNAANSYSNVIKAAVQPAGSLTPVKVPPPGLNPRSTSASPLVRLESQSPTPADRREDAVDDDTKSLSQLPPLANEHKTFWETIPRLSTIPQSRLHNPLPFQSISQLLESSLLNCPDSYDAEKPRQYSPKNIHPSSIDYPQEPMYELNTKNIMEKFDNDTLFFCFYYSEGINNLAKWNSAQELSRRGWIFNTETKQWFARDSKNKLKSPGPDGVEEEPADGEDEGNYKYFDYEKTWLIRRKDNFVLNMEVRERF